MPENAHPAAAVGVGDLGWDPDLHLRPVAYALAPSPDAVRSLVFSNEPYQGRMRSVFAWLGIPPTASRAQPVPGIVALHGGGGMAYRTWVEQWVARGYAAIAIDHAGGGAEGRRLPDGRPPMSHEELFNPRIPWRDTWLYHAIAATVRAHSILAGQAGVAAGRIGLTGISWGGYLTCIAAAVDPRLVCAASIYGCGHLQRNCSDDWMECFQRMTEGERRAWHAQRDPAVFLPRVHQPLLFVTGLNDQPFPLDSLAATTLLPAGPVALSLQPGLEHSMEAAWAVRDVGIFCDQHLRRGEPLPRLGTPVWAADGALRCELLPGPVAIRQARLVLTRDHHRWQDRTWVAGPARLTGRSVSGAVPADATAAILLVEDERGAITTTRPQLPGVLESRSHQVSVASPILIRVATTGDAAAAVAVLRASIVQLCQGDHQDDPATLEGWLRTKTVEHFCSLLLRPEVHLLVAAQGPDIRGVGSIGSNGELGWLYVSPGCQGQGIGAALLAALESRARDWGLSEISLISSIAARAFYERHGYRSAGPARPGRGVLIDHPYVKTWDGA